MYVLTTFNSLSISLSVIEHCYITSSQSLMIRPLCWSELETLSPPCWPISKQVWVPPPPSSPPTISLSTNSSQLSLASFPSSSESLSETKRWAELSLEEKRAEYRNRMSPLVPLVLILPACVPSEKSSEWKAGTKTRDKRRWLYYNRRRCFNSCRAPLVCVLKVLLLFFFRWHRGLSAVQH